MEAESMKYLAVALTMFAGSVTTVAAEGWIAKTTMEAIGRNPEISDSIFSKMIVGMAICESTGIYCLVISLIMLFVA